MFGLSLLAITGQAQDAATEEVVKVVPNYGGLSATAFWTLATVIIIEIVAILFMMSFIGRMKAELMPAKEKKPLRILEWWKRMDKKIFTAAVPVEKEADIELDHEYDGIKELDNSLPPWWKWGFIITIFISIAYMLNFHAFGSGKNPTEEYEAELVAAKAQMEAYAAKNKDRVDENNIVMADAAGIAAGEKIFQQVCWACHGKAGEGGAGPNLTDDYWMHKGSLTDIYLSIKHGYPDKGMQAWEKQYSPKQISDITSYIKSLQGTNPAGAKAPQGDLFTDTAGADSTTAAVDSVKK
ncbi:MAG: c-type cytochrome [Sphingobacteriales bacterium]|nr:MAG: c-type cytochrome [Sphingobacteriales bacterium]